MEPEEAARFADLMPADAIALHGIRIVRYVDEDGTVTVNWQLDGKPTWELLAGLLEMTKFDALRSMLSDLVHDEED